MEKVKFIFVVMIIGMFLVPTSASSQEVKEGTAFDSYLGYEMFGSHSEGEIYGTDRSIEYTTMHDVLERYSTPSSMWWVNKVIQKSSNIVISIESGICRCAQDESNPEPRYISVYYIDENDQLRRFRIHFGKGSYERSFGKYKILVSAETSSIYEGETLVYNMKNPSNA